jgi:hypothetical protein
VNGHDEMQHRWRERSSWSITSNFAAIDEAVGVLVLWPWPWVESSRIREATKSERDDCGWRGELFPAFRRAISRVLVWVSRENVV